AIVLTSGNISERPILIDNDAANEELKDIADAVITYNRDIYNRVDDSVVFSVNNSERTIRRSRGYAPAPIQLDFNVEGILATGAELVNCFSIGKGKKAFMSQHIGDLKNLETYDFFMESLERYKGLFRTEPKIIACDMHPDYLSSNYAASSGLEIIKVQHHHAHIASCMAENRIDGKVIGVALDGTGLGTDGNIWGGEFLFAGYEDFERFAHFSYLPIPGGDIATSETWRTGLSILYSVFGTKLFGLNIPFVKNLDKTKADFIISAIDKNINCPLSSSAGRLFDAISAITCICTVSKFHAEAPMRLESVMQKGISDSYSYSPGTEINFSCTVREIVSDILSGTPTPVISAKFHNTLLDVIIETSVSARDVSGINRIALSGGTFQNRYLLERSENMLREKGFEVFSHHAVPSNDGGIALGQLVIAATILKERGNIC
ncbi:MAG: Sua5/YciO/YrdC/YwlC family protein, partial [Bacteroidota bacterium]